MLDRQKLEALLARRFPGSTHHQVAAAANAIMGLEDEWEEVANPIRESRASDATFEFRVLRRRGG